MFLGLSQQVDVLAFWKQMEVRWPRLSAMARDHLPTPATSVGVERVFNSGRDVVSYRRCHLRPSMIRKLVMMKHAMASGSILPSDEQDDEEDEEPFESLKVRSDMVWAWNTDLISEGEGAIDDDWEQHSMSDDGEEIGDRDGPTTGEGQAEQQGFIDIDNAASASDDDEALSNFVPQQRSGTSVSAGTRSVGVRYFFRLP